MYNVPDLMFPLIRLQHCVAHQVCTLLDNGFLGGPLDSFWFTEWVRPVALSDRERNFLRFSEIRTVEPSRLSLIEESKTVSTFVCTF